MTPPRFTGDSCEDAFELLIAYENMLYNLGLVDTRGVDYTTFQLDLAARHLCRGYLDFRLVGSPSLTWT